MPKPVLYHSIPSRGFTVHWLLEEMGIDYDLQILDMATEQHKKPEFLAINPLGRVPALVHGDVVVTETAAICLYLAEQFPQSGLCIDVNTQQRGEFLRWMFFAPVTMEPAIISRAMGFENTEYKPFASVEDVAATVAATLANQDFLMGDVFTAADVVVGSGVNWGLNMMPVLPKLPELTAYWERLNERPAWQRVTATMS